MATYNAPINDMMFLFEKMRDNSHYNELEKYKEVNSNLAKDILGQAAKITENLILPLAKVGDDTPCVFENGVVRTPPGYKETYKKFIQDGWTSLSCDPEYGGQGRRPKQTFQRVDLWCDSLEQEAWTRIKVRDGEKGPLELEIVKRRVVARTERGNHDTTEELLVVTRSLDENRKMRVDYHLSNAPPETPLEELARVAKAEHRIEDCLKRSKSEAGLSDYEVRTWTGWYHHQTLSLIATWFLVQETRRGKKIYAGVDCATSSRFAGFAVATRVRSQVSRLADTLGATKKHPSRAGSLSSLQTT